jgi:tetratricopeptide (TPR) repeat protein
MASQALEGLARCAEIRCWGDFSIRDAATGADLRPRGRKARAMLAYLALHAGKPISRARLTGLLWSERGEDQARASLRQTLFELRDFSHGREPLLDVQRDGIALLREAFTTDIDAMQALLAGGDYQSLLAALPEADETLFANFDGLDPAFDDWLSVERTRQGNALTALVADASAGALAVGQARTARTLHARLLELNPDAGTPVPAALESPTLATLPAASAQERPAWRGVSIAVGLLLAAGAIGGATWLYPADPKVEKKNEDVRGLYDAAHGIIYRRKGDEFPAAIQMLRRALAIDPANVPVMADLASVLAMTQPGIGDHPEAERLARTAVRIDPKSAMANGVLGMVLGFTSLEARVAIKRAAKLDLQDPQIQFWLSNVLALEGDYPGQFQALRRAIATDPQWHRATGAAALAGWQLGYRQEAENYAAQLRDLNLSESFKCDYAIDWERGDYSEVVRNILAVRDRLSSADAADRKLGLALLVLGQEPSARLLLRLPPPLWRVASGAGPAPGELEPILIGTERDEHDDFFALTALRQTLKAGRAGEIVAAYDRRAGRLRTLASADAPTFSLVTDGLQVALALRQVGREREAAALLDRADAAIRRSQSHGAIPNWMYAAAASIWAAQGRKEQALAALEEAIQRGWHYAPMTPMPDMGDIPSFAGLRGDPRFEQLRHRLNDHLARERRALGKVPV